MTSGYGHTESLDFFYLIFSLPAGCKVLRSVGLSTRICQKSHVQISSNFQYMAVARSSSDGSAICYVLPVFWMTSCFHIMDRVCQNKDDTYVSSSSPGGGTGVEVCRLRLHLAYLGYCSPPTLSTAMRASCGVLGA